jgi:hypothetical protein
VVVQKFGKAIIAEVIIMMDFESIMKKRDTLLKEVRDKKWEITQLNQNLQTQLYDAIYKLNVLSNYKWVFQPDGGYCGNIVYLAIIPEGDEWSLLNLIPTGEGDDYYGYDRKYDIIKNEITIIANPATRNSKGHVTLILGWDTALKTVKDLKLNVCGDYLKSIEDRKKRITENLNEIDILEQLNKLG